MSTSEQTTQSSASKARHMNCACCGVYAGQFQQWFNRDTGFGVCRKCLLWMKGRSEARAGFHDFLEERRTYGLPGINYAAGSYVIFGHKVTLVADFPANEIGTKAANDFVVAVDGASVLAVTAGRIWIAMKGDLGEKVENQPEGYIVE